MLKDQQPHVPDQLTERVLSEVKQDPGDVNTDMIVEEPEARLLRQRFGDGQLASCFRAVDDHQFQRFFIFRARFVEGRPPSKRMLNLRSQAIGCMTRSPHFRTDFTYPAQTP